MSKRAYRFPLFHNIHVPLKSTSTPMFSRVALPKLPAPTLPSHLLRPSALSSLFLSLSPSRGFVEYISV
ncbi:unnamed protein product [Hymenolepis diminuta]|uniref:Uncharacterized protein n=1 Tax=Hymenolepis diminuta TaxID=6216 RepID=A0A564YSV6_HYMDI|nr:unnamed protein product [Hymenolepis diminuta]